VLHQSEGHHLALISLWNSRPYIGTAVVAPSPEVRRRGGGDAERSIINLGDIPDDGLPETDTSVAGAYSLGVARPCQKSAAGMSITP